MPKRPPSKNRREPRERAPLDAQSARGRALKLLSRREHSAAELTFKLKLRGADDTVAGQAVQAMASAGWQSDSRYAEMLARNRAEQGYGPLRIRAELTAAAVPEAEIRAAMESLEGDWRQRCAEAWRRRFGSKPAAAAAEWQKQYRFLAARGFGSEAIRATLGANRAPASADADFEPDSTEESFGS